MIAPLKEEINKISKMLVENTDECFCVNLENDDSGSHYVLYLVEDSVPAILINSKMFELKLSKHHMIIFLEEDRVHSKRKNNEK